MPQPSTPLPRTLVSLGLGAALALAAAPAGAQESIARHRGTVESRDGDTLTVRLREGGALTAEMGPRTRVLMAQPGRVRDIKPESYVAVVTAPGPDGAARPTHVSIFSPSERGFEAGSQPWDTAPGATLTAGWIEDLQRGDPREIRLGYQGGNARFAVPRGTTTAQISPGEKAQLVPGADVTVFTRRDAQGTVNADVVAVGRRGAVPTL